MTRGCIPIHCDPLRLPCARSPAHRCRVGSICCTALRWILIPFEKFLSSCEAGRTQLNFGSPGVCCLLQDHSRLITKTTLACGHNCRMSGSRPRHALHIDKLTRTTSGTGAKTLSSQSRAEVSHSVGPVRLARHDRTQGLTFGLIVAPEAWSARDYPVSKKSS